MNATRHLLSERTINCLMTRHEPLTREGFGHHKYIKMRLRPSRHIVHMRLVHHIEMERIKCRRKLLLYGFSHIHGLGLAHRQRRCGDTGANTQRRLVLVVSKPSPLAIRP